MKTILCMILFSSIIASSQIVPTKGLPNKLNSVAYFNLNQKYFGETKSKNIEESLLIKLGLFDSISNVLDTSSAILDTLRKENKFLYSYINLKPDSIFSNPTITTYLFSKTNLDSIKKKHGSDLILALYKNEFKKSENYRNYKT